MPKASRVILTLVIIFLAAAGTAVWWFVYRPLPQTDGAVTVGGLHADVGVDRDSWGVPHIRAASLEDLIEAQGYVMAQDRLWQMDLLRRAARGRLAEIFGDGALAVDKEFRVLGFGRAAERDAAALTGEPRMAIEAYARGVNKFIEQHHNHLPVEFSLLHYKPEPWLPSDCFVISAYMYQTLTDTWEDELNRAKVTERVGPERAKELFSADAAMDHFVVGDPNDKKDGSRRAHRRANGDEDDDDEMDPQDVLKTGNFNGGDSRDAISQGGIPPDINSMLWPSVHNFLNGTNREIRRGLGSNNWVVSGAHTATGKPLLANDTHLELSVPSIWYELHLAAPGYNAKGFTLPGAPLVVIGHNNEIAWGFTNNGADVQDLYIETFNPGAPDDYRVNGAWKKAHTFDEVIHIKGKADEHLKLLVTRHGPIVRRDGNKGYALRWTATEPGGLANTYNWLGKAHNWEEFRNSMKTVWGPAQNAVYADVSGNIGYVMAARVPIRKKGRGEIPVPGDTDDYEWTGYIPFDQLPQALNPESGLIVTANARVVGPDYKPYLTDRWEEPYRTARIVDLLQGKRDLRPEDMLRFQNDTYNFPYVFLAEQLSATSKTAQPKDARALHLIQNLKGWNGMAGADSVDVPFLYAVRRSLLALILEPYLGKDTSLYEWRSMAFLQKVLTERPTKWLPPAYKTYEDLLAASADDAVAKLGAQTKSRRVDDWAWKNFNSLQMHHPIGDAGLLKFIFSIPDTPQPGTGYSIRAASQRHGPSERFVANPANWDDSIMLIPTGESGQLGSSHYTDQFSFWFDGKSIFSPFSEAAEIAARKHTLTLKPGN
ncbi:MAG: penicillin acylase family protein [Acidobacteriota bacterium]|nr:penicillin acylase family protein [Acidobacteriota bacterium]